MKLIDNTQYVEFSEMVECGVSERYLKKAKSIGTNSINFIKDPSDNRKVLIEYESLSLKYKEQIIQRFGNPYDYAAKEPIKKLIIKDHNAETFYLQHSIDGVKKLPPEHVAQYTTAASWLNALIKLDKNKDFIKKQLGLSLDAFYTKFCDLIKFENVNLPSSYRRLRAKAKEYEKDGYVCLISEKFGNPNAAKIIGDHISSDLLLELLAHPMQHDDVFIAMRYNSFALQNKLKPITDATVGVWRRKKEHLIIMQREGNSAFNEKFIRSIPGKRPSAPLYLVEHDDNHLDFLFKDEDDKTSSKNFHRYKAIVVIDSFNDLVLGKAYAETITSELIYAAYADAMHYLHHLTGGWYLPFEVKCDNWGIDKMKPFYEKLGDFFKTPVGSKHRGFIEPFFRTPHWKRSQRLSSTNNYTGHNMTAKYRGVNTEFIDTSANLSTRTKIGHDAFTQIENFFYRLRHMPQNNGMSKEQEWLQAWNALPDVNKKKIDEEQLLYTIGIQHQPKNGSLPRISNEGIHTSINRSEYIYSVPNQLRLEYTGTPVNIFYDPFDMSRVLVTDGDKIRFIAHNQERTTKAMQDHYEGSRAYLNSMLSEKLENVQFVDAARQKRQETLITSGVDAEALLLSNMTLKEVKHVAEHSLMNRTENNEDFSLKRNDWMDKQTDFSQYQ